MAALQATNCMVGFLGCAIIRVYKGLLDGNLVTCTNLIESMRAGFTLETRFYTTVFVFNGQLGQGGIFFLAPDSLGD